MERIYAAEENFIVEYLAKMENATAEERKAAEDMYSGKDMPEILTVTNNTAYISIVGPLSRTGPSPLARYFGYQGASYAEIIKVVQHSEENPAVEKIIFLVDSPGGEVAGVDEVSEVIAGCSKPTTAVNMGMIASAAYWIASACDKIEAKESTSMTGSIGVVITAVDFSKAYEEMGVKIVQIVSRNAPNKRPDIKTEAGLTVLQDQADAIENVFMDRVATGRGVPIEAVRKEFGRGGMLIASNPDGIDAIKVKMIDGLTNMDSPVSITDEIAEAQATAESTPEGEHMEEAMNRNEFFASNPAEKTAFEAELNAKFNAGVEAGKAEVQARIDKVAPIMASDAYDSALKTQAQKAMEGKISLEAFESVVAMEDMRLEREKSTDAQEETSTLPETPAEQQTAVTQTGAVESEDDYQAAIARSRSELGIGGAK